MLYDDENENLHLMIVKDASTGSDSLINNAYIRKGMTYKA